MKEGCLQLLRRLRRYWLAVSIVAVLIILGAAIAFATVDSAFRQNVFFPILDNVIASIIVLAIVGLINYWKNKEEKGLKK